LNLLKLFKSTFQSYFNKINLNERISLFKRANSYISSHYHRLCSYLNPIRELKPNKQRRGRW